jgi:hypothetical protein
MTPWFQHCDPLIGVLDYIVEVRQSPHGYARSLQVYLVGSKRNALKEP